MKSIFASLSSEDMSYLKQQVTTRIYVFVNDFLSILASETYNFIFFSPYQLSFAEELEVSLSQMFGDEYNLMVFTLQCASSISFSF